ncbi:GGDEF domain-containing protein [Granulicella tundricola]|uniref:Diguanylate cyclase n=1 Tax=Granulicella tundricola (strain ATCC BAA-1859 / DSM 23138 / MP5ACTX9) TaxID=1198114 RepID=E8WWT5_GRATM|nr:GGDEF domain-containing protein [Granulicella tundricola]ADW67413.1 diguanylate cyclase [Granulicella tundricola MP5ACTX9]
MDLSVLPDIFALSLLIGAYRPLVRRAGAHVNLWFVGWAFVLVQAFAVLFEGPPGLRRMVLHLVGVAALELCGVAFILAAANSPKRAIRPLLAFEMALPLVAQVALSGFAGAGFEAARYVVSALFVVPLLHVLSHRLSRRQGLMPLGIVFALFGIVNLPVVVRDPGMVTVAALAMVYLSAAYVCLRNATRLSKGVVTTVVGMALWGLKYPFVAAMHHFYPGVHLEHGLMVLPQYAVVAGSILSLLEEHVIRTERMAMHDALTDLPNRRLFEERFAAAMEEARREKTTIACLVIDVDDFKHINDTMGHAVGDELLRALAVRLSWHMSPRDILARTGGDEFTAMLAGVTDEHHLRFIASAMMSAASVPIAADGRSVDVRISMGIALSPDHADDIEGLREAADEAMYRAKRRGGNLLAFAGDAKDKDDLMVARPAHVPAPILQMKLPMTGGRGRASRG